MSLHEGCEKILVSDSVFLADRMYRTQKRGINCKRTCYNKSHLLHHDKTKKKTLYNLEDMLCSICDELVFDNTNLDDFPNSIIFFCRHAYHERCLLERDEADNASAATAAPSNTIHSGTLTTKINHAALLKSTRDIGCILCREQAAGGNAFVNRMKTQRRGAPAKPMSPGASSHTGSVRSLGVVH